jgi:methylenetetrahydrofolate reductase (NADPH)
MEIWLNELAKRNILDKVYILIGITPLKTFKMAKYMNDEVPGVFIPETLMKRMEAAEKAGNAQEEGVQIALELIEQIKTFRGQGVNGLHIMAVGWEDIVPRIVREAGLMKTASNVPEKEAKTVPAQP